MPSIGASLNPVRLVNKILGRNKKEKAKSTAAVAATQTKAPESVIAEGKPAPSVAAPTKVVSKDSTAAEKIGDVTLRELSKVSATPSRAKLAVVELFTSEGCSSCPPADSVLEKVSSQSDKIIPIGYHVDYWDYLGWKDRFSAKTYTAKQRHYSAAFNSRRVYTPQMVINGNQNKSFVGSSYDRATKEIKDTLKGGPFQLSVGFQLQTFVVSKTKFETTLEVEIEGLDQAEGETLQVVLLLTEDDLTSKVKNGENSGRTLRHSGVVRAYGEYSLTPSGETAKKIALSLTCCPNERINVEKSHMIVYVQESSSKTIVGASHLDLSVA